METRFHKTVHAVDYSSNNILIYSRLFEHTHAPDSAKAEGSSIVDEPGEG